MKLQFSVASILDDLGDFNRRLGNWRLHSIEESQSKWRFTNLFQTPEPIIAQASVLDGLFSRNDR